MFDSDFCGFWALSVAMCLFRLFFSHNHDYPSPQNRFKGPKAVRFKNLRNSRKQKNKTNHKGWFHFLVAGVGFDWMMKKAECEYNDGLFAARDCAFE